MKIMKKVLNTCMDGCLDGFEDTKHTLTELYQSIISPFINKYIIPKSINNYSPT